MNSNESHETQLQIDRLVDGELSKDEYHELLKRLDSEPDGWRVCAMAFLESQALQQEFATLHDDDVSNRSVTHRPEIERSVDDGQAQRLARIAMTIAATIAIGFVSGSWWQTGQRMNEKPAVPELVKHTNDVPQPSHVGVPQPIDRALPRRQGVPIEHLTFVVDRGDGQSDRFELPVYEANDQIARQLIQDRSPMPEEVERELRNAGFNVRNQRGWAPVRLRDGRRAFFPVDQVDITPVSRSTYQ